MNSTITEPFQAKGFIGFTDYHLGDCLEILPNIPTKSVDFIFADLPYGETANPDDVIISPSVLWNEYKRICKGTIVLTANMRFAVTMISSNLAMFKYDRIWEKNKVTGFLNAKKMPLRKHELILVFYDKLLVYNPQKTTGHKPVNTFTKNSSDGINYGVTELYIQGGGQTDRYPTSILSIPVVNNDSPEKIHNNQKPVDLLKDLILTYTNENMTVLDNTMGSGTTGVACVELNRNFIGIEKNPIYFSNAIKRIENAKRIKQQQYQSVSV